MGHDQHLPFLQRVVDLRVRGAGRRGLREGRERAPRATCGAGLLLAAAATGREDECGHPEEGQELEQ